MAGWHERRGIGWARHVLGKAIKDLRKAHRADPRSREFNREREPVDPCHEFVDELRVEVGAIAEPGRALDEEFPTCVDRERWEFVDGFAGDRQWRPRGG